MEVPSEEARYTCAALMPSEDTSTCMRGEARWVEREEESSGGWCRGKKEVMAVDVKIRAEVSRVNAMMTYGEDCRQSSC